MNHHVTAAVLAVTMIAAGQADAYLLCEYDRNYHACEVWFCMTPQGNPQGWEQCVIHDWNSPLYSTVPCNRCFLQAYEASDNTTHDLTADSCSNEISDGEFSENKLDSLEHTTDAFSVIDVNGVLLPMDLAVADIVLSIIYDVFPEASCGDNDRAADDKSTAQLATALNQLADDVGSTLRNARGEGENSLSREDLEGLTRDFAANAPADSCIELK